MTSTIARRSATALSAVALAAVLGTPAYADQGGQPNDNASDRAAEATAERGPDETAPEATPADERRADPTPGAQQRADDADGDPGRSGEAPGRTGTAGKPTATPSARPAAARGADDRGRPARPAQAADEGRGDVDGCKNPARPDQDGVGADRGIVNDDKNAPGADCNNGCGNDEDREDDNNGWCGRKHDKVRETPAPVPNRTTTTGVRSGGSVVAVATPAPRPVVRPAIAPPASRPVVPATVAGVRVVRSRPAPSAAELATLPYTGDESQTLMILGVVLVAGGLVVREIARSAEATA